MREVLDDGFDDVVEAAEAYASEALLHVTYEWRRERVAEGWEPNAAWLAATIRWFPEDAPSLARLIEEGFGIPE